MKNCFYIFILICTLTIQGWPQNALKMSPIEQNGFRTSTSYSDVASYIDELAGLNSNLKIEEIGISVQGRKIQLVHPVLSESGNKIKVMIFCQQHGNEPAGKEMSLMLLRKIAGGNVDNILSNIDLYIIPLVNPDGNEEGKRANSNGEDLNRNHLLLTEPEVLALHNIYSKIDPDVTLDIHEYSAYRKEFRSAGYIRTDEEEFGAATNPNVSAKTRDYSLNNFFSYLNSELGKKGVSFSNYFKMDSPDDTVRPSTTAIGDGRQSFAILGSLSFILEGRGGKNMNSDLKRRVTNQLTAIETFLDFVNQHNTEIKQIVADEKKHLQESNEPVAVQMNYVYDNLKYDMKMNMLDSEKDSIMSLPYTPTVKVLHTVNRPKAYLIPKDLTDIKSLLERHGIKYASIKNQQRLAVEIYTITDKKKQWLENKKFDLPVTSIRNEVVNAEPGDIIVPINQRAGTMLVIALEPESMWGLFHTDEFNHLCKKNKDFPIYRITELKGIENEH